MVQQLTIHVALVKDMSSIPASTGLAYNQSVNLIPQAPTGMQVVYIHAYRQTIHIHKAITSKSKEKELGFRPVPSPPG